MSPCFGFHYDRPDMSYMQRVFFTSNVCLCRIAIALRRKYDQRLVYDDNTINHTAQGQPKFCVSERSKFMLLHIC